MRRDTDDDMRRRRAFLLRRNAWQHREREKRMRMAGALALMVIMGALLTLGLVDVRLDTGKGNGMDGENTYVAAEQTCVMSVGERTVTSTGERKNGVCTAALRWPLAEVEIMSAFDGPDRPWLPGHRGVDLRASGGTAILAPADGVVSFAGTVAGKRVVSLRHGGQMSSFEPAVTTLAVGASVTKGKSFATVSRGSDHCDDACLHWGVRRGDNDYLDPETLTGRRRIALKPIE